MLKAMRGWTFLILTATALAACSWNDVVRGTLEGAKNACRYQDNCSVEDAPKH